MPVERNVRHGDDGRLEHYKETVTELKPLEEVQNVVPVVEIFIQYDAMYVRYERPTVINVVVVFQGLDLTFGMT